MALPDPASLSHVALLGTGTIGASWATYFLARGFDVTAWDPAPDGTALLTRFIDDTWPVMERLGLAANADRARLTVACDPRTAVEGAAFIQENGPEDATIKRALYREIDGVFAPDAVLASSSSGLLMGELQAGLANAARFVIGHPFNPPHLVPLVEVVRGRESDPAVVDWAVAFYAAHGKHPIRVNKEVPGHIANRLQAALQREAYDLVLSGVASPEDVDAAVAYGPGLRWAFMGPYHGMHLAGGAGGLRQALEHFGPSLEAWWADMKTPQLDGPTIDTIIERVGPMIGERPIPALAAERDDLLLALLEALARVRAEHHAKQGRD